jgi:hypothetical protein
MRHDGQHDRGVDEHHEERQAVDAEQARHLRERQHRRLAVAKEHPGKAGEHMRAAEFRRDPHQGRQP